jgi:dTDP-4-dehydrorhamnose reductase
MRVAVTGSQGQVVRALLERAPLQGIEIVTLGRPQFDLVEPSSLTAAIASLAPDIVVNAAAYTAVDKAEAEEVLATRINAAGAGAVALAAFGIGAPIIQLSTDYVFDGELDRPYLESDPTGPVNAYGRSKLLGEQAVRVANPRHAILRTSWIYGPFGANFVRTMLRLGETRDTIGVVADQIGAPTNALDIADAILDICHILKGQRDNEDLYGLFHLAGGGAASWADFAEAIFTEAAARGRKPVTVARIATTQYPTPARRPRNSQLDTQRLATTYGVSLPPWRKSLPQVIAKLLANE